MANAVADLRFRDAEEGTSLSREKAVAQIAEDFEVSTRRVEQVLEKYKGWFDQIEQSWRRGYPGEVKRLRQEANASRAARASLKITDVRRRGKKGLAPKRS